VIVVTSGSQFLDIDAYGSCLAAAELLQLQGKAAQAVSTAPLNDSITPTIRSWQAPLTTKYQPNEEDTFILVDVSDPAFFDPIVDLERVVGVIDHHTGFEQRWADLPAGATTIEFIGAACTLVYEQWQRAGQADQLSQLNARLLMSGILDNTLNFKAQVTTERDRQAYAALSRPADLPDSWPAEYFEACQHTIEQDVAGALANDTKLLGPELALPVGFGQLVVWDAQRILAEHQPDIVAALQRISPDWAINIVSISEGHSYLMAASEQGRDRLASLLNLTFSNGLAKADRLWLRKEIIKAAEESLR
jgi:inorganic pyrophosphatase/exopolyphosphatase